MLNVSVKPRAATARQAVASRHTQAQTHPRLISTFQTSFLYHARSSFQAGLLPALFPRPPISHFGPCFSASTVKCLANTHQNMDTSFHALTTFPACITVLPRLQFTRVQQPPPSPSLQVHSHAGMPAVVSLLDFVLAVHVLITPAPPFTSSPNLLSLVCHSSSMICVLRLFHSFLPCPFSLIQISLPPLHLLSCPILFSQRKSLSSMPSTSSSYVPVCVVVRVFCVG